MSVMNKCREFKVGDVVVCVNRGDLCSIKEGVQYRVTNHRDGFVTIERGDEDFASFLDWRFELVTDERQALSDAMDLCVKHGVHIGSYDGCADEFYWHSSQRARGKFSKVTVLDIVFPPTETEEQIKLKELEEKQLLIADEMKKLRESMA